MRRVLLGLAVAQAIGGAAQAATYTYVGQALDNVHNHSTCTISPCVTYSGAETVTGTFTTSAPLSNDLSGQDISPLLTSYSFTDGRVTIASSDPMARIYAFTVDTDDHGNVIHPFIVLQQWYTATPASGSGDINERQNFIQITGFGDESQANGSCESGLANGPAATSPADTCGGAAEPTSDTSAAQSDPFSTGVFTAPVPTLSDSAMALAVLMLVAMGLFLTRRQSSER